VKDQSRTSVDRWNGPKESYSLEVPVCLHWLQSGN